MVASPPREVQRAEISEEGPGLHAAGVKGQAVSPDYPRQGYESGKGEALHQHRQDVLRPNQTSVEQGEPR